MEEYDMMMMNNNNDDDELGPFTKKDGPTSGLTKQCIGILRTDKDNWKQLIKGMTFLRRIVRHCAGELMDRKILVNLVEIVVDCLKSLRSVVSKNALLVFEDMFDRLEAVPIGWIVSTVVQPLVARACDNSNEFIRTQSRYILKLLCEYHPSNAIIDCVMPSLADANFQARKIACTLLEICISSDSIDLSESTAKDLAIRTSKLQQDSAPEVRQAATKLAAVITPKRKNAGPASSPSAFLLPKKSPSQVLEMPETNNPGLSFLPKSSKNRPVEFGKELSSNSGDQFKLPSIEKPSMRISKQNNFLSTLDSNIPRQQTIAPSASSKPNSQSYADYLDSLEKKKPTDILWSIKDDDHVLESARQQAPDWMRQQDHSRDVNMNTIGGEPSFITNRFATNSNTFPPQEFRPAVQARGARTASKTNTFQMAIGRAGPTGGLAPQQQQQQHQTVLPMLHAYQPTQTNALALIPSQQQRADTHIISRASLQSYGQPLLQDLISYGSEEEKIYEEIQRLNEALKLIDTKSRERRNKNNSGMALSDLGASIYYSAAYM